MTLPFALTRPFVFTLPDVVVPLTDKLDNTPTDVKLEPVTPELINVPVSVSALADEAVTPVRYAPLPI